MQDMKVQNKLISNFVVRNIMVTSYCTDIPSNPLIQQVTTSMPSFLGLSTATTDTMTSKAVQQIIVRVPHSPAFAVGFSKSTAKKGYLYY